MENTDKSDNTTLTNMEKEFNSVRKDNIQLAKDMYTLRAETESLKRNLQELEAVKMVDNNSGPGYDKHENSQK